MSCRSVVAWRGSSRDRGGMTDEPIESAAERELATFRKGLQKMKPCEVDLEDVEREIQERLNTTDPG